MTIESSPEIAAPRYTVLVVDDDLTARSFFRRLLDDAGYVVKEAVDGAAALQAISALSPDVVLLDIELPEIDGFEVCRRVRQNAATRLTPVIIVTGFQALEQRIEGLEAGADDFLTKPVDQRELLARVRSLARIKSYTDDLDSAAAIIMTVATMIEARDGYSQGHCSRMANYALRLGRMLQFGDDDLQALHRGGFLHDIGMLAIPDSVLRKRGSLEPEEYELIRSHTIVGDKLCGNLRSLQRVRPIIRSHHERLDGSGYPDGLQGDQIPLIAQVIGVVDVYEALTAQRPYQDAHSSSAAIEVLWKQVASGWRQREIVEAFVEVARST